MHIYYVVKDGVKIGCLNYFKLTQMYPGLAIRNSNPIEFEGYFLNFEWSG